MRVRIVVNFRGCLLVHTLNSLAKLDKFKGRYIISLKQALDFSSLFVQATYYVSTLLHLDEIKFIFMSRSKGTLIRALGEEEKNRQRKVGLDEILLSR